MVDSEKSETAFLKSYLSSLESPIVFDVGGNRGQYSTKVLSINTNSEIYSFEPNPKLFGIISKLFAGKKFNPINLALGDTSGKIQFYDYESEDGQGTEHGSLYKDVIETLHHKKSIEFEVEIDTVDNFCIERSISHINLLKIDTEGHEMGVLLGAKNMLSTNSVSVIQIEFNEMNVISRVFLKDFMNLLADYKFYRILKNGFIPIDDYFAGYHEIFAWQNIIAVNKNSGYNPS